MANENDVERLRDLITRHGLEEVLHTLAAIIEASPPPCASVRKSAPTHLRTCAELVGAWSA